MFFTLLPKEDQALATKILITLYTIKINFITMFYTKILFFFSPFR